MTRLRKLATRKYEFDRLKDAENAAIEYAKEDKMDYAVIQEPAMDALFEVVVDDFDHPSEIPGIVFHTSK